MKLFLLALQILLSAFSYGPFVSAATSIEDAVGSGCENRIAFSGSFSTDSGEECNSCALCDGYNLNEIFKPKGQGICVQCASVDKTCKHLSVIATFESAWNMQFLPLSATNMPLDYDPKSVSIEGSDDSVTWIEIFKSDDKKTLFKERNDTVELVFEDNAVTYKSYKITFALNDDASKMYVGHLGVVPACTKTCVADIYSAITGNHVKVFDTVAPTQAPSNFPTSSPTDVPTDPPILTNIALKGTATQASTYGPAVASRAIDGNTDGHYNQKSVAITNSGPGEWWKVNLNGVFTIQKIIIFNRTDKNSHRLGNSDLRILDTSGKEVATKYIDAAMGKEHKLEFDFNEVVGSYVEVKLRGSAYLQLAEVQVFGHMNG